MDWCHQCATKLQAETAGLRFDTGHLYDFGLDPVTWLGGHAARLGYVYFEDIRLLTYQQVLGGRIAFFDACARGVMCRGELDYPAIKRTLSGLHHDRTGARSVQCRLRPARCGGEPRIPRRRGFCLTT